MSSLQPPSAIPPVVTISTETLTGHSASEPANQAVLAASAGEGCKEGNGDTGRGDTVMNSTEETQGRENGPQEAAGRKRKHQARGTKRANEPTNNSLGSCDLQFHSVFLCVGWAAPPR
jgi:hypothetical protein